MRRPEEFLVSKMPGDDGVRRLVGAGAGTNIRHRGHALQGFVESGRNARIGPAGHRIGGPSSVVAAHAAPKVKNSSTSCFSSLPRGGRPSQRDSRIAVRPKVIRHSDVLLPVPGEKGGRVSQGPHAQNDPTVFTARVAFGIPVEVMLL